MTADLDPLQKLQSLIDGESGALGTYRRLARDITDPTADVALELLMQDTRHDRAMLQQIVTAAGGALMWTGRSPRVGGPCALDVLLVTCEIDDLSRVTRARAQQLRDLACCERGLNHAEFGMLLDAIAGNCDKHARLLGCLGRYLRCQEINTSSAAVG